MKPSLLAASMIALTIGAVATAAASRSPATAGASHSAAAAAASPSLGAAGAAMRTETARGLAAGCAACHGTAGHAVGGMPSLAGMPAATLRARLRAFRDDARSGTVMPQLARGYRDDEIDALAAWFAAQRATPQRAAAQPAPAPRR